MKTNVHRLLVLVCVVICLIFYSCQSDEKNGTEVFDQKLLLQNIGDSIILPEYDQFLANTATLFQACQAFSTDLTVDNLNKVRAKWLGAANMWKSLELIKLGPIEDLSLATSIDNWPTNTIVIEQNIETDQTIDNNYINSLGSSGKGLPALEYLLYEDQAPIDDILAGFQNSTKRTAYLVALADNLNKIAQTLLNAWSPAQGNYIDEFINSTGNDVGSTTTQLANNMLVLVENIKNNKIGIPLGKKSLGEILPYNAEAWRSDNAIPFLITNLKSLQKVFNGGNGMGFDDYLDDLNAKNFNDVQLSLAINEQFNLSIDALEQLDPSIFVALESDLDQFETAFEQVQILVIMLKTDMMSNLGLLVTFSDNDGD